MRKAGSDYETSNQRNGKTQVLWPERAHENTLELDNLHIVESP
jgi:hypothetical protein